MASSIRQFAPTTRTSMFLLLALTGISAAGGVQAQAAQKSPSTDYSPIPGYRLTANAEPNTAKFFHSPARSTVLIYDSEQEKAFVVDSRKGRVAVHAASDFITLESGDLEFVSGKKAIADLPLKRIEKRPAFNFSGVEYRVMDKAALPGRVGLRGRWC